MSRTVHVHLSARGTIKNFRPHEWRNVVKREDGTYLTPDEVKDYLIDQLAQGHEAIPFGKPCEGFSFKDGCPGHDSSREAASSREVQAPSAAGPSSSVPS